MAADDGVCGGRNMTLLLQRNRIPPDTLWMPSSASTAHDDVGMNCMVTFENVAGADSMDAALSLPPIVEDEHGNEDSDICFPPPVKKRRLTTKQVQFLERSFEVENKLEPDRKMQLAKELGLQPRQVAIWFQNRRARFRNKQLEKDYMSLRASFDQLKSDYDNLIKENENLRKEILSLKEKSLSREKGVEKQEPVDDDDAGNSPIAELQTPVAKPAEMVSNGLPVVAIKQEDASSAKSDVFDSDRSPSLLEPTDSSHVLEPDQSDFSQDEEDNSLSRNLLPQLYFQNFYQDPTANSCNFEFPVEDQSFWSWNC